MATQQEKLSILSTQQEKPNHYTYLKEFRVEQCQSFLQHKCNQHRPFICFNWHFQNQRRRRPVRKRDGTFNYSADNYCTKYDETTGICPDGDECPFLHRTAGDTERRYHLRYYKTCMCVHDTDSRGYCVKNGHHCAFAHGIQDQRPPVYDIKELESLQNAEIALDGTSAQNALDKERNLMNEDPKWQDTNYVLSNYKTEPCKRPPRLCRQGYACPQYHNSKDKRRSPRKFKYRSTPCPNVKHGEEWGEPGNCESGDNCQYCHTRTEQQFHPEIYKSTKCNDVQQAGYCPRSVFCAFAHVEPHILADEQLLDFDGMPTSNLALAELIMNALPTEIKLKELNGNHKPTPATIENLKLATASTYTGTMTDSAADSPMTIKNKAPGAQLAKQPNSKLDKYRTSTTTVTATATAATSIYNHINNHFRNEHLQFAFTNGNDFVSQLKANLKQTLNGIVATRATTSTATTKATTSANINGNNVDMLKLFDIDGVNNNTNTVLVSALESTAKQGKFIKFSLPLERLSSSIDDARENSISASLANSSLMTRTSAPINIPNSTLNNSINDFNSGGFAVNIPNSSLTYSPTNHSSLFGVSDAFNYSGSNSNKLSNSLSAATQNDSSSLFFPSRIISPGFGDGLSISPSVRLSELRDEINSSSVGNNLFDNSLNTTKNAFSLQSLQNQNNSDIGRLTTELMTKNAQILKLSNRYDDITRQYNLVEIQRDKAKQEALEWKDRYDLAITQMNLAAELRNLSIQKLKQLQSKLRSDLEDVEKVLYLENAKKCMKCEENNRTVTLEPCNHFILCDSCACSVTECPYCQVPIVTTHT